MGTVGIYSITNLKNHKRYIGQSKNIQERFYKQGTQKYSIIQNGKTIKTSIYREPLIDLCNEINKEFKEIN